MNTCSKQPHMIKNMFCFFMVFSIMSTWCTNLNLKKKLINNTEKELTEYLNQRKSKFPIEFNVCEIVNIFNKEVEELKPDQIEINELEKNILNLKSQFFNKIDEEIYKITNPEEWKKFDNSYTKFRKIYDALFINDNANDIKTYRIAEYILNELTTNHRDIGVLLIYKFKCHDMDSLKKVGNSTVEALKKSQVTLIPGSLSIEEKKLLLTMQSEIENSGNLVTFVNYFIPEGDYSKNCEQRIDEVVKELKVEERNAKDYIRKWLDIYEKKQKIKNKEIEENDETKIYTACSLLENYLTQQINGGLRLKNYIEGLDLKEFKKYKELLSPKDYMELESRKGYIKLSGIYLVFPKKTGEKEFTIEEANKVIKESIEKEKSEN